jgi:Arc/MetJ family transcription regulator
MRTTLNLDNKLVEKARRLTGIREKATLLHAGLEALISQASARRLAARGGTERSIAAPPHRRARS